MTKVQIISDIHLNSYSGKSFFSVNKEAEVIIFAGDIVVNPKQANLFFTELRKKTSAVFLYILGNHEYYNQIFSEANSNYKKEIINIPDVYLLNNESFKYKDIVFSGCTLWTDYDSQREILYAVYGMLDFQFIFETYKKIVDPYTIIKEHEKSKKFLKQISGDKNVFITHHMPSFSLIQPEFKNSRLNGSFAVDLDDVIFDISPRLWVCGHTHSFIDTTIGLTRIICNPIGYPRENLPVRETIIEL